MKKLLCEGAAPGDACNWEFLGETDEEVLRKAREHGKRMHNADIDESKLRPHIRNV
jgi:predicted small metal-binding protein